MNRWLAAAVLVACGVCLGASSGRKPAAHTVVIEGMEFNPATLSVRAGDSVTWINKDVVDHTATTAAATKPAFDSGVIGIGKSWKRSFEGGGTYDYLCTFHPTMKGVVKVR